MNIHQVTEHQDEAISLIELAQAREGEGRARSRLDMAAVREKLRGKKGQEYWRGLEEIAETKEFQDWVEDEFPNRRSILGLDRRDFLKFMGASMLLAGLGGCRGMILPQQRIVPYVKAPEDLVLGRPLFYATASTFLGYATGVVVEQHEGRPTKVDGNPDHPAIDGHVDPNLRRPSLDAMTQATILQMYDPDRAPNVTFKSEIASWDEFFRFADKALDEEKKTGGAGFRILTRTVSSPSLVAQMNDLKKAFPQMQWHQWEACGRDNVRAGATIALERPLDTIYRFDKADVVLSLDSEFLTQLPGSIRYAKEFAAKRNTENVEAMSRLYAVESAPTLAGANADHRLPMKASEVQDFALALAAALGVPNASGSFPKAVPAKWASALVKDLESHRGRSVVVPGDQQTPEVHALCHAINAQLANVGQTVFYVEPATVSPLSQVESLRDLVDAMAAGKVNVLLIADCNPIYDAPSDFKFAEAMAKVGLKIRLGLYHDETSAQCDWSLPNTHYLEAWSDARALEGTVSIVQPLIAPLYDSHSLHEVINGLLGKVMDGYQIVQGYWKTQPQATVGGMKFDQVWQTWLNAGLIPGTESPIVMGPAVNPSFITGMTSKTKSGLEIVFRPDPRLWDGRYANLGWLMELPNPLTTITWDNCAQISPKTAEQLGLASEDMAVLEYNGQRIEIGVWVMPGHPDDVVSVHLGFGRTKGGIVADGAGVNLYPVRSSKAIWSDHGARLVKGAGFYPLAATQLHHSMEGRNLMRSGTVAEYLKNKEFAKEEPVGVKTGISMYPENPWTQNPYKPEKPFEGSQWAMTIDLNHCIGCNACVTACQAENNIPVVGKVQVKRGREMHWIRIDRYYKVREGNDLVDASQHSQELRDASRNDPDLLNSANIDTVFQPVTCMHCEMAPCEPVCPVAATVHSHEGINQMVYNRCVGTRYCSNNCPYKVRRFNYLNYADRTDFPSWHQAPFSGKRINAQSLILLNNPSVTVRGRGVMEKCTFCVQRINSARIAAKKENRKIREGEVKTACQEACPTHAIVFGDITDKASLVSRKKQDPRNYAMLEEINTRPRVTYLARLRNPNPEIENA
ncbi:MAG TPA: TAT-variant-translocated molybdopterin oxidoreductase [Fimbriimonadaceae bacterium]|nr:TAT-variant-translocated molybdopterin oxidoreductase [Fimbriimonadaceae bacterium]